jgi:hypothetical protein
MALMIVEIDLMRWDADVMLMNTLATMDNVYHVQHDAMESITVVIDLTKRTVPSMEMVVMYNLVTSTWAAMDTLNLVTTWEADTLTPDRHLSLEAVVSHAVPENLLVHNLDNVSLKFVLVMDSLTAEWEKTKTTAEHNKSRSKALAESTSSNVHPTTVFMSLGCVTEDLIVAMVWTKLHVVIVVLMFNSLVPMVIVLMPVMNAMESPIVAMNQMKLSVTLTIVHQDTLHVMEVVRVCLILVYATHLSIVLIKQMNSAVKI